MSPAPRTRVPGERMFVVLMILLSAFLLWASVRISGLSSYTSAGSFPMAASALMLVCGLVIGWQSLGAPAEPPADGESAGAQFRRRVLPPIVLWLSLLIILYILGLERIGFLAASYLFLVAGIRLLGEARWALNLAVSALVLAAIYVVFQTAFSVVLPTGSWWQGMFP